MIIELFEVGDGCGYRIVDPNGLTCILQEFDPDEPGEMTMTREVAQEKAEVVLARLASE